MMIDRAQTQYAVSKIVDELVVQRDDDGNEYVVIDHTQLAFLVLLAQRATRYDVDSEEIVTLTTFDAGWTVQSILDAYAS